MTVHIKLQYPRIVKEKSPIGAIILPAAQNPAGPVADPWIKFSFAAHNMSHLGQNSTEVITLSKKNKAGNQTSQNKTSNQSSNQNNQSSQNKSGSQN